MSLKHFAMLSALSYHNHQNSHNSNNNNTSTNYNNYKINNNTQTTIATTNEPEFTSKIINNSYKSTLTKLKQHQQQHQHQHQQQQHQELQSKQIIAPIFSVNTTTTTTTTTTSSTGQHLNGDKTPTNYEQIKVSKNYDSSSDLIGDDSSNYSSESSEYLNHLNQKTTLEQQQPPPNTYIGTTYYGSGFGVFHQQDARSNGGGIALITGSSASNGLGGSYSNGINNNVNLLLGGAMLTLITTILCVVCYCCHRNIKKRTEAAYRQQRQWLESDPNMEIYSVEQCYETSGLFVGDSMDGLATIPALHHEPPPSYDTVVAIQEQQQLIMQQQQQHIMMQQQLLQQQQFSTNNSPPPGYRSSLDVSAIIQHGTATGLGGVPPAAAGGSTISDVEINSLASSTANVRTSATVSPVDPLLNYNDANGNVPMPIAMSTSTPTNNRTTPRYLRSKQQRNMPANQISQVNMKKVLQAQSCCSLQRAEVENMWNAAAAALAARSAHLATDCRASTTASTSSSTLAMSSTRKQSQDYKNSNSNTPETFGSRYLKQNYYKSGCPLCGKFRYDNESALSISMESNLDTLAGALTDEITTLEGQERISEGQQRHLQSITTCLDNRHFKEEDCEGNEMVEDSDDNDEGNLEEQNEDGEEEEEEQIVGNGNEGEHQCSCLDSRRINEENLNYQNANAAEDPQSTALNEPQLKIATLAPDDNANGTIVIERQSTNRAASNTSNNNDITNTAQEAHNLPSTSVAAGTTISRSCATADNSTPSPASTPSVTIDLDCINENGIISLDMSKIIDKTGLPTYDAALKLESSGYV